MRPIVNNDEIRQTLLFLPVEIRSRELFSKLILSHTALNRHFIPIIGEVHNVLDFALKQGASGDIFIHKGGLESKWVAALKAGSISLCILDEELSPSGAARGYASRRVATNIAKHVDLYLATSLEYAEEVSTAHPILRNRTTRVGFLRLDLLSERIRNNLIVHFNPETDRPKILICTGFGITNKWQFFSATVVGSNYLIREGIQRIKSRSPRLKNNILKTFKEILNDSKRSLGALKCAKRFANDLNRICEELKGEQIFLRPHPSEDQSLWNHAASSIDNLSVRSETPLEIELLNSSLLVHFGSTTAFQAREYGLSSISLSSIYNWKILNKADEISALPMTLEDAVTVIRRNSKTDQLGKAFNTDSNVAERILDCLDELRIQKTSLQYEISGKTKVEFRQKKIPRRTPIAKVFEILDIGQTRPHESRVAFEHVSAGLDALCGPNHGVRIKEVEGCFILTRQSS